MTTKYKILFTVDLQNEYYSNQQSKDFSVIASAETARLLRNRQMLYKMVGNKLVVLIKVKTDAPDTDKPFSEIEKKDRFLFYLSLNSPQFATLTNLDEDSLRERKLFYFSNLHENDLGGALNLTQRIVAPVGPANFKPGDFTADGAGTVYECIKSTTSANPPPNPAFWHNRTAQQYVSSRDMVLFTTRTRTFVTTAPATQFNIRAFKVNTTTKLYTEEVSVKNNLVTTDTNTDTIQADLSDLLPGRYRVLVNANEYDLYIDDDAIYNGAFGVIEIFSHFNNGTPFAFWDATGKVKDTVIGISGQWLQYRIRFANRMAYWKYITTRHDVTAIDGGVLYSFDPTPAAPGPKDFFTSNKPIPLTEIPSEFTFTLSSAVFSEPPLAPNPDPNITGMLSRTNGDKDYYCTINLNY